MTKQEFIKQFAEKANISQKLARDYSTAMFDLIFETMKSGDDVSPVQGMKFHTAHQNERTGRNPSTGETIVIGAREVPKVKFSKNLKDMFA